MTPNTTLDTNGLDNKILKRKIETIIVGKSAELEGWKWNKILGIKFDFAEGRQEIKRAILENSKFNSCGHFFFWGGGRAGTAGGGGDKGLYVAVY